MRLETRICKCGCGRTFRVTPKSKNLFFSYYDCQLKFERKPDPRLDFSYETKLHFAKYKSKVF